MFPIILDVAHLSLAVIGSGPASIRRLESLQKAGARDLRYFANMPDEETLHGIQVAFVGDFDDVETASITAKLREMKILANAEDKRNYCDFHVPALVRRGDLLLTVSTNGKSPRLARRIRMQLESLFPAEWAERLKAISTERLSWKKQSRNMEEIATLTDSMLEKRGWL